MIHYMPKMSRLRAPRLLLFVLVAAAAVQGGHTQGDSSVVIFEAPTAEAVKRGKQALDKWTAQAATERGLVNVLLGNSCFTTAISALNRECSQLTFEQRCWLAIQFSMCFQRASGFKVMNCPTVCPKRRSLQSCVEECTQTMDDRQSMTYTQFFGDVLNMCLFLQTQNFQQVTAALVTDMHASSAAANASLGHLRSDLAQQSKALAQSLSALGKLQAVQVEVHSAVQAGLKEVQAVGEVSHGLQRSMHDSLNMTAALSSRHESLMQGFSALEIAHQQHAARAHQAFNELAQEAAALEHRQERYEALQTRLLNASHSLLDKSQDMNELLRVLLHYQSKGNTILSQLQGSSVSLHDVLFYTLALSVPLVFITYPTDVRFLLLGGILACWGIERAVLQHCVMLFGALRNDAHAAAAGGGGSYGSVQDVKIAVRLLALGGTLGVVVWLLVKRMAARSRREAIFQAIQESLHQAQLQQAMACQAGVPHAANLHHNIPAHPNQAVHPMGGNQHRMVVNNQLALPCGPAGQLQAQGLAIFGPQAQQQKQKASSSRGIKAGAATAAAHAAGLPPTVPAQLLSPVLLQQAAHAAGYSHAPVTPAGQSRFAVSGWLPPLFAPSQGNTAQHSALLQHLATYPGQPAAAAAAPGHSHAQAPQQHLHTQQQLLLQQQQQQQQQQQHMQAPQPLQQEQHAKQLHGDMQVTGSQTGGTVGCTEGIEESMGTGAGASESAGTAGRPKRAGRSPASKAAPRKGSKAAGRKRTAAAAVDDGATVGEGDENASEAPAAKQGRSKRKK